MAEIRRLSQGMERLVDSYGDSAANYGGWHIAESAETLTTNRARLVAAMIALEARNATLESENCRLTQLIEDMRGELPVLTREDVLLALQARSHHSESGK